jgi:cell division protein FtsW (lipid II flippase)
MPKARNMIQLGKTLFIIGIMLTAVGIVMIYFHKIPFLGRLPGDIYIKKDNFSFFFPLTTSIVISAVLSLLFWIFKSK